MRFARPLRHVLGMMYASGSMCLTFALIRTAIPYLRGDAPELPFVCLWWGAGAAGFAAQLSISSSNHRREYDHDLPRTTHTTARRQS